MTTRLEAARAAALLSLMLAAACGGGGEPTSTTAPPTVRPTVSVSPGTVEIRGLGDSALLVATASPPGASLTWSVTPATVATLLGRGSAAVLTAVSGGTATVSVEASINGQRATASTALTVVPIVRAVRLDSAPATLLVGRSQRLSVRVTADAGTTDSVRWVSRTVAVATVSSEGVVTAVAPGVTTLLVMSTRDSTRRDSLALQVVAPAVRSVVVTPAIDTLFVGATRRLSVSVTADSGLDRTVTWRSSAATVASVSDSGVVSAIAPGTTQLIAIADADTTQRGTATVIVRLPAVRRVQVRGEGTLVAGTTTQFVADVVADLGVPVTVSWRSSQPGVASVDSLGRVVAIGAGTTRIVARSVASPTVADSVLLTVTGPPRFSAWESSAFDVVGGGIGTDGTLGGFLSVDTSAFLVGTGFGSAWNRTLLWRGTAQQLAPNSGVPHAVSGLSMASDGGVAGWVQFNGVPRTVYRLLGTSFVALPALPAGLTVQRSPTALPGGRVAVHARGGGFDVAMLWNGTAWEELFRVVPRIPSAVFSHLAFFSDRDVVYYEPVTPNTPRDHVLLRWRGGAAFDTLPDIAVEGSFFFTPGFVGRSSDDFYTLISNSRPLRRLQSGTWSELHFDLSPTEGAWQLALCPVRPVLLTTALRILSIDGSSATRLGSADPVRDGSWSRVHCAPDGTLRRAGAQGRVERWADTTWVTETFAPTVTAVRTVSASLAYVGLNDGSIHRWNGNSWSVRYRPADLAARGIVEEIAAWPDGRLVATVRRGPSVDTRLTLQGTTSSLTELEPAGVRALWGPSADDVWGITPAGALVRSRFGGPFEVVRSDLRFIGVGGRLGGRILAVADKLQTVAFDGVAWQTLTGELPGLRFANVAAIWSDTDAWAAGTTIPDAYANRVYRFTGTAWESTDMSPVGGSDLSRATFALFTPGPGEVYALHGTLAPTPLSLHHWTGGAWTTVRALRERAPTGPTLPADGVAGLAIVADEGGRVFVSRPGIAARRR